VILEPTNSFDFTTASRLNACICIRWPSKVLKLWGIADDTVDGLLLSFANSMGRVAQAGTEIGKKIQNGIKSGIGMVNEFVDRDLSINPVISPVLDLSGVTPGIRSLNGSLHGGSIAMRIDGDTTKKKAFQDDKKTGDGTDGTQVVYNQYITSTKSLTTGEIYRLTKMQVARKVR